MSCCVIIIIIIIACVFFLSALLFSLFQMGGDLEDLEAALNKSSRSRTVGSGSCSALIKVLPDGKDLLVSHDTWNTYQSMLRILKRYSFAFHTSPTGVNTRSWVCSRPRTLLFVSYIVLYNHCSCRKGDYSRENSGVFLLSWQYFLRRWLLFAQQWFGETLPVLCTLLILSRAVFISLIFVCFSSGYFGNHDWQQ